MSLETHIFIYKEYYIVELISIQAEKNLIQNGEEGVINYIKYPNLIPLRAFVWVVTEIILSANLESYFLFLIFCRLLY